MDGMSIEQDGRECRVLMVASGRVVAIFDGGSAATNRRHAEMWIRGEFDRESYESDVGKDVGWTGQHVLAGMKKLTAERQ